MKNYLSILLTAVLLISMLALSGCNSNVTADVEYVKDQGKLVVGVIDAPPLTELNDEGEWTGLAADLARGFGKELGVDVEFKEIDWTQMEHLLNDKTIDCVASALTLTAERRAVMSCTKAYLNNSQIVVTKAENARKYTSAEDCLQLKIAVLDGSTHETLAKEKDPGQGKRLRHHGEGLHRERPESGLRRFRGRCHRELHLCYHCHRQRQRVPRPCTFLPSEEQQDRLRVPQRL